MRKSISIFLALTVVALVFAGCSSSSKAKTSSSQESSSSSSADISSSSSDISSSSSDTSSSSSSSSSAVSAVPTAANAVATVTSSVATGTYTSARSVRLTTSTAGATIYYTKTGSAPSTSSAKYTGAFTVSGTTTIKAIAVKTGLPNSAVASIVITIAKPTSLPGNIVTDGSTALQPLLTAITPMFESTYSSAFKGTINIGGGGSTAGIQDLHNGQVGIGDSDVSEYLAGTNYGLKDHIVATVGVAVVVSNDVYNTYGIKQLPQSIIKGIFNGTITDWGDSAVTPYESTKAAAGTNINVFYRSPGSGTRILFENYCMNQGSGFTYPNDTHHHQESSSSLIAANVGGSNTNAIGYETLPYVQGLNAISIKFDLNSGTSYVAPNYTNIDNGIYPMWGYEHLFTVGTPNATLQAFIDYVTSPTSQTTILNNHYGLYTNLGGTALANVGHR